MRHHKRKGSTLPVCWFLFSVTITFLILRMAHGQPQAYFKANAPVVKSLPRIGRRSDLDTFPLPLPPPPSLSLSQSLSALQQSDAASGGGGNSWPESYFYRADRQQQGQRTSGDNNIAGESSSIPFVELDHITPSVYAFWRKFMMGGGAGRGDVSENVNSNIFHLDDSPMRNIYRSRTLD